MFVSLIKSRRIKEPRNLRFACLQARHAASHLRTLLVDIRHVHDQWCVPYRPVCTSSFCPNGTLVQTTAVVQTTTPCSNDSHCSNDNPLFKRQTLSKRQPLFKRQPLSKRQRVSRLQPCPNDNASPDYNLVQTTKQFAGAQHERLGRSSRLGRRFL